MKKPIQLIIAVCLSFFTAANVSAQSIEESCSLINSEVKDSIYGDFSISGTGFLTYTWHDNKGSETILSVEISKVTFSKDETGAQSKVWIKCTDGTNCITEKGILGNNNDFSTAFSKTYIPTRNSEGMDIVYRQLNYLYAMIFGKR